MAFTQEQMEQFRDKFPPKFAVAKPASMVMISEVDWSTYILRELTCVNHPWARYYTKNIVSRTLHFIQGPNGLPGGLDKECECPVSDLRVVNDI